MLHPVDTMVPSRKHSFNKCESKARGHVTKLRTIPAAWNVELIAAPEHTVSWYRSVWTSSWIWNTSKCCAGCGSRSEGDTSYSSALPAFGNFSWFEGHARGQQRFFPESQAPMGMCDCFVTISVSPFHGPRMSNCRLTFMQKERSVLVILNWRTGRAILKHLPSFTFLLDI